MWGHYSRAHSKPITSSKHLLHLCRYIHANPVKDEFVADPADWPYSNYLEWIGERDGKLVDHDFVQRQFPNPKEYRDFVLENLHYSELGELNKRWSQWREWYNWHHRHRGLNGDSPADHYVRSLRRPTKEDLELLLIHEEPRKVMRTGCISYYGQFYRVPDRYIGRRVWTILKGDMLWIESGKEIIARHRVKTDYLKVAPQDS